MAESATKPATNHVDYLDHLQRLTAAAHSLKRWPEDSRDDRLVRTLRKLKDVTMLALEASMLTTERLVAELGGNPSDLPDDQAPPEEEVPYLDRLQPSIGESSLHLDWDLREGY